VVVGNIGSESRAKYGIIGAAVNMTHRIQGQAQGGEVVVSEMVFHHSEEPLPISRTFETKLKGITHSVTLHVVERMGVEPERRLENKRHLPNGSYEKRSNHSRPKDGFKWKNGTSY